jgi:CHAT domain-containing protein
MTHDDDPVQRPARIALGMLAALASSIALAAEAELFGSGGPLPADALTGGCHYVRGVGLEWATGLAPADGTAAGSAAGTEGGVLALGNVQAVRFGGTPLRALPPLQELVATLTVERAAPDRVLVDLRAEIDHGCVLELKRFPLARVDRPAPRIAQIRLVEQMAVAIFQAGIAREALDHAASARQWARALEVRAALGLPRDDVTLQIDQQRIQSWALAGLPVAADEAQRLVEDATASLGAQHAVTGNAYTALGWTLRSHGRHFEAIDAFRRAHELTAATQGPKYRATLRLQQHLATQLLLAGQRREALALMEDAYRSRVELLGAQHEETWRALDHLVDLYVDLGRVEDAEVLARQSYERNRKVLGDEHRMTLVSLATLTGALRAAERYDEALPLARHQADVRSRIDGPARVSTVRALADVAELQLRLGRIGAARETMRRAQQAQAAHDAGGPGGRLALLQARVLAAGGETEAARDEYGRLLERFERQYGPANRSALDARFEAASLALDTGDAAAAAALYADGIDTLERLRAEGGLSDETRQALLAAFADVYRRAALAALRRGRHEDVLRLTELSKARSLLDNLTQRRAEVGAGLAPDVQARLADLASRINATQAQALAARDDPIRRAELDVRKADLVRELAALQEEQRARVPKYAQLSTVRLVERTDQADRVLPAGTAFVSYVIVPGDGWRARGKDVLLALVARRGRPLAVVDLGAAADLADLVRQYRTAIGGEAAAGTKPARAGEARAARLEREISDRWLRPLQPHVNGSRRLVFAPDGPLATLPFEPLRWNGARLIEAFEVSYAQSLSVYALLLDRAAARRAAPRQSLFAIGAPETGPVAGAPQVSVLRGLAPTAGAQRAARRLAANWAPLPGARDELRAVAGLFARGQSEIAAGRDATEDLLDARNRRGDLAGFRYLLFATHGLLDPDEPGLSALVLGRASEASVHDGYVTAIEWLDYRLRSELAVLSACSSGEGRLLKGEGVLGLPYAMFVAGNRDAVLTLWAVADRSTREFVTRFFREVRAGRSHAQALAIVKRQFAREGPYRAPAYWAGFVLYGS